MYTMMLRRATLPGRSVWRAAYSTSTSASSSEASTSQGTGPEGEAAAATSEKAKREQQQYRSKLVDAEIEHARAAAETRRLLLNNSFGGGGPARRGGGGGGGGTGGYDGRSDWTSHFAPPTSKTTSSSGGRLGSKNRSQMTPEELWQLNNSPSSASSGSGSRDSNRMRTFETWTSRSVPVSDNGKIEVAWRRLNSILAENAVRKTVRDGERFEPKSDKRVRLASARHRKRFAVEVGRKVAEALRLRNKKTIDF